MISDFTDYHELFGLSKPAREKLGVRQKVAKDETGGMAI